MTTQALTPETPAAERTLAALGLTTVYAVMVGFSDNYVRLVAEMSGLWQFHLTRGLFALLLLGLAARLLGLRLRPKRWLPVVVRALLQALAILIYFGALAFMPVAVAAAGLFTAPIFVLLISRLAFKERIGPVRILAVALGFIGVVLVLGPGALAKANASALLPVAAGAVYAMANLATRRWCGEESAATLLAGFFTALALFGALGLTFLALWPVAVPAGAEGFLLRGWVWPDATYLSWMLLHAVFSCLGVGLCTWAYLMADAGRVSVIEYLVLPTSAFWGWLIWGESLGMQAWAGIVLIVCAGALIALRAREQEQKSS